MSQAQRTASTRAKLLRAAFDQLRINGYAQFRTATVARNAGVSQGGQLHHFPSKEGLALAAVEFAYDSAQHATTDALDRHDHMQSQAMDTVPRETLRALVDDSMGFYFSSTFDVALDVVKGAAGNAGLRRQIAQLSRNYRGFAEQSWCRRLMAHGWSEKESGELIELTTALVRGFAIRRWIQRDSGQFKQLLERWLEIIEAGVPRAGAVAPPADGLRLKPTRRTVPARDEAGRSRDARSPKARRQKEVRESDDSRRGGGAAR